MRLGGRSGSRIQWREILSDINIGIQPGERVRITGENGSGKSSLISVMAGIYRPTTGTVQTYGRVATLIGFAGILEGIMSGVENALLFGSMIRFKPKAEELCDICEISWTKLKDPVNTWSSGMRARLLVGVSALSKPDIWLIDEAFYTLDTAFKQKIRPYMNNTVVFVSHSDEEAALIGSNRSIKMRNGLTEE